MENSNPNIWRLTEDGVEQVRNQMLDFLTDPDSVTFIAKEKTQIIGYADGLIRRRITHLPLVLGHIGNIFVEEAYRNRGAGALLVNALCEYFERMM